MPTKTRRKQSRSPVRTKVGPLTVEEIMSNDRLRTIWRDMGSNVAVAVTAAKPEVGIEPKNVFHLRAKIRAAIKADPDIRNKLRNDLLSLFPVARVGLGKAMDAADASALNGFFRGLGMYRNEDSLDVTVQSPEEVQKRRLAQLEAAKGKVRR